MFSIAILETICVATTVMVGVMTCLCCSEIFSQIDKAFIKLKEERNLLKVQVETLENEMNKRKEKEAYKNSETNCSKAIIDAGAKRVGIPPEEINRVLVDENRRLHIRCDMLVEELLKTRESTKKFIHSN